MPYADKAKTLLKSKTWYHTNKSRHNKYKKGWRKKNPEKTRNQTLKQKYGITLVQSRELMAKQGFKCAICAKELKEFGGSVNSAHIDHCHKTGRIRGVLCSSCNKGLGFFLDNKELLTRAIGYLDLIPYSKTEDLQKEINYV